MTSLWAVCRRCGEAFETSDLPAEMCAGCRAIVAAPPVEPLPIVCLDDGTHVAECTPVRADIDEPDDVAWQALAAEFDAMDLGLARREHVREMLLRAWAGGAAVQAASLRDSQDSDAWDELLAELEDADLTEVQRDDILDHAAAHARRCVSDERGGEAEDDDIRRSAVEDARATLHCTRETLRDLRRHAGTPVLPAARVSGEITVIDARLREVDDLLEAAL